MLDSTRDLFITLSRALLRCWLCGFFLLLIWFGLYMAAGEVIHRLHGGMFGLSNHEMDVIFYCGMGLFKLLLILFFVFPWLALRMVLRKD
jgi:hypothetical protein